ncbi:hypothetical protein LGQ02_03650 [Bacillus shivajii]|uniref:CHY zinc finger protein n=1 Tax=Bacillus shivajii TaxID=1983719 RepID=UPI001CF9D975|nr:CHY zinc finger protein [Bacillus shivajii]UCZ53890.1 hypothetical protein LGQ02_03650 [Bacillus shivajii]
MKIGGTKVRGIDVDNETRCTHYDSEIDRIAIKFKCCNTYYPCYSCHAELTTHTPKKWSQNEFDEKAILCGACGTELSINEYMNSGATCPNCEAEFNPKCANHYHLYFDVDASCEA